MAVEKSKMIERFKVLFPKVNLSKERMDMIMDKLSTKPADGSEDPAIDEVINDFNGILPFEEIAKSDDKTRKLASDLAKADAIAKGIKPPAPDEDQNQDSDDFKEAPAWAKAMAKQNATLQEELKNLKDGKITDSKFQQVQKLFSESDLLKTMDPKIAESWIKRVQLDSEIALEDQVAGLNTEYGELVQSNVDAQRFAGPAGVGKPNLDVNQEAVNMVVDKMNI